MPAVYRQKIEDYLTGKLLPFWFRRVADPAGGFTTHFDGKGDPSGETDKTLIQQARCTFMLSHVIRYGYGNAETPAMLRKGMRWFLDSFRDREYGGWFWIVDKEGKPLSTDKIVYGHGFVIYAMSEYALATGDAEGRQQAEYTFDLLSKYASDTAYGGYREMFLRDFQPRPGGAYGGERKSLDVHMHLMEAYTSLFRLTGKEIHRRKLEEVIEVLIRHMFDPKNSTGISQFGLDFTPLPAIMFRTVWGADRDLEGAPRPLNNTSYGHNIEFLWLFLRALDVLRLSPDPYLPFLKRLAEHTLAYGIDTEYGGVYVEGPNDGPARDTDKEFWQQAESLVGLLDAFLLFKDERFWNGFTKVFGFVWDHMIRHEIGEWVALCARDGTVKWDYLGHAWKNNYHTVRSMIQCVRRLEKIGR